MGSKEGRRTVIDREMETHLDAHTAQKHGYIQFSMQVPPLLIRRLVEIGNLDPKYEF